MRILKNDLIEHPVIKGFFQHPEYSNVFISKNGVVYNNDTNSIYKLLDRSGYNKIKINNEELNLHRLVCETFLEIPKEIPSDKLIPNHLNGLRWDNRVDNLEWTDYAGNLNHAYATGLRKDASPILVKDLRTGEITRHYSLQECARHFNVNGNKIFWYLKDGNIGKPCFDYYIIIREGMEWPDVGPEIIGQHRNGQPRSVVVFDKNNDKYIIFETIGGAAEYIGRNHIVMSRHLNGLKEKEKLWYENENWKYCYLKDYTGVLPDETECVKRKPIAGGFNVGIHKQPRKVSVENISTGEVKDYVSINELARELDVKADTLKKHIWIRDGVWKQTLRITYLNK